MKLFSIIIVLTFSIYAQSVSAQTFTCPVVYNYDNAGNRYERLPDCPGGYEMLKIDSPSTSLTDSITNLTEALYPNPTVGPVNIVFNNPVSDARITIVDNVGRQLYWATVSGTNVPLDLSNLAQGIYYVTVKTGGNTFNSNIVKQ